MKCDEEKPACRKCRDTGRICDGYAKRDVADKAAVPSLLYGKLWQQSYSAVVGSFYAFLTSGEERRHFDYFQSQTRQQISSAFGSSTQAHQLILQGSHSNTSIKHTVLALGSLGEQIYENQVLGQHKAEEDSRLLYTDTQYSRAITELQKDLNSFKNPPIELILTSCLLLSLFDFLRGESIRAQVHLRAGIDILCRFYTNELSALKDIPKDHIQQPSLVRDFAIIFSVMDLHAAIWLGSLPQFPPLLPQLSNGGPELDEMPRASLDDVSYRLNCQVVRAHVFHHKHTSCPKSTALDTRIPFHVQAEKQRLLYELEQWPSALTACLLTMPPLTPHESRRITLMRMNYKSLYITLSAMLCPASPSLYAAFTRLFTQILADATSLFEYSDRQSLLCAVAANCKEYVPLKMPLFAFVVGAIQPLYLTATRCVDPRMCEQAVRMLEQEPWREGAWNSIVMARLARQGARDKYVAKANGL